MQFISFPLRIPLTPLSSGSSEMCLLRLPGSHMPCHQIIAWFFINHTDILQNLCGLEGYERLLCLIKTIAKHCCGMAEGS
jgi:hypothetical protein